MLALLARHSSPNPDTPLTPTPHSLPLIVGKPYEGSFGWKWGSAAAVEKLNAKAMINTKALGLRDAMSCLNALKAIRLNGLRQRAVVGAEVCASGLARCRTVL